MEPEKKVTAKFQVYSRTEMACGHSVLLQPVTSGSKENEEFYKWTPNGKIELGTINKEAAEFFNPGKAVYVTFTQAP